MRIDTSRNTELSIPRAIPFFDNFWI